MASSGTRSTTENSLVGQPDSVLSLEWIQALADGRDQSDILPFSGRPKLPTKEMVIKLYLYYRSQSQHQKTSAGDISDLVLGEVVKYWKMANIETVAVFRLDKYIYIISV